MARKLERWTPHAPEAFETLACAFAALAKMANDVGDAMRSNHIGVVRVEHWKGTKTGMCSAQKFLLDARSKAMGATVTAIEGFIDDVDRASKRRQKPEVKRLGKATSIEANRPETDVTQEGGRS